jgi:hypothetical protein
MEIFKNVLTSVSSEEAKDCDFVQLSDYVQIINRYCGL